LNVRLHLAVDVRTLDILDAATRRGARALAAHGPSTHPTFRRATHVAVTPVALDVNVLVDESLPAELDELTVRVPIR